MAMEVKVMDMAQFAEILKSDQRSVSFAQCSSHTDLNNCSLLFVEYATI